MFGCFMGNRGIDWSKYFVCLDRKFYNGGNLIKCFMCKWKIGLWILVLVENICIYVVIIIIKE